MSWNYENLIREKLNLINNRLAEADRLEIEVATEQAFVKTTTFKPNTIYVVIKYLSSSISYEAKTQPAQMVVLCEQNTLNKTQTLLNTFVDENNWSVDVYTEGNNTTYIKQQYSSPVVLSNFNEVGYGRRSIVYFTATLYIMENVADVKDLTIDGNSVEALGFNITYSMTGNTQPVGTSKIATTIKNIATFSIGLTIPLTTTTLTTKILNIANGTNSGNADFNFHFKVGSVDFPTQDPQQAGTETIPLKLVSAIINTAPNQVPSLQVSFMR